MDGGKHNTMKPMELHTTRREYMDYPLKIFREHIYQEELRRKFIFQRSARHKSKK